jgi:hypothetical protein
MRIVEGKKMEKLNDLNTTLQGVENALLKRKVARQDQELKPDEDETVYDDDEAEDDEADDDEGDQSDEEEEEE